MRILIATNSYPTDKNPTRQVFVKNMKDALVHAGHECTLVYNRYFDFFKSPLESGTALTGFLKALFLTLSAIPTILWKARKVDIIYSHAPYLPGLLMNTASRLHGIKHVIYAHGSVITYTNKKSLSYKLAAFAMKRCDRVFTNSQYMKKRLMEDYDVESVVVTPGYNSDVFKQTHKKRSTDILFAGNCIHRKGVHILLQAVRDHYRYYEKNSFKIRICCSGKLKPEMMQFCKSHGLYKIITIENKLEEKQLAKAYNCSKIVLFPSLDEPLGLVGIEAIACGAFLIASDTGGIPEYVTHGVNGLLFEPASSLGAHQAIKKTVKNQLWEQNENQRKVTENTLERYSLEYGTEQAVKYFEKILDEKK